MIVVTGSTGYLGSRLVQCLLHEGHAVRGLVLPQEMERARALAAAGMEIWCGDLLAPASLVGIARDATTVYHLAGMHTSSVQQMYQLYVEGTQHLLSACRMASHLESCIVASNASIYGDGKESWLTEDVFPSELVHPFASITRAMEQTLLTAHEHDGFPCVLLRIAEVYGPDTAESISLFAGRKLRLLGDGQNWTSHISSEDVVTAMMLAASYGRPGESYNVADDLPARSHDFYTTLALLANMAAPQWTPIEGISERIWLSVHGLRSFSLRLSNAKVKQAFPLTLRYPTYQEGIRALVARTS